MAQTIVRAGSKAFCSTSADGPSGALGLSDEFEVREESGAEKKDLMELWTFLPSLGDDIDGNMSGLGGLLLTNGMSVNQSIRLYSSAAEYSCVCVVA